MNAKGYNSTAKLFLYFGLLAQVLAMAIVLGHHVDVKNFYIPIAIIPFIIFGKSEKPLFNISLLFTITNIILIYSTDYYDLPGYQEYNSNTYVMINHAFNLVSVSCMIFLAYLFMSITELGENLLVEQNQALEQQKKQLHAQNNQLEESKDEQERLNALKDRLLSIIAHDLRNPLTNLQGITDLVLEGRLSKEETEFVMKSFRNSANNTSQLLDNLLTWSSAQLKMPTAKVEHILLHELTNKVFEHLSYKASPKNIVLINKVPEQTYISADFYMMEIVLRNLLINAIKFSHTNQQVTVWTECNEDNNLIHIEDHGIGIPSEIKSSVFEADSNKSRYGTGNEKGFGIGLLLCKQLIESNNGRISFRSEPGKATIFTLSLPLKA